MKRFTSMMLVLVLVLGFVPSLAPVNASAATTLSVSVGSTEIVETIIKSLVSNEDFTAYNSISLTYSGTALSSSDWTYLRKIFSENGSLKTLAFGGASLKTIPAVISDEYAPHWERVILPDSLTTIGNKAFRKSTKLTDISIPKLVSSIGTLAFSGCISLTAINIDSGNTTYKNLSGDGVIYSNSYANLHTFPAGKSGDDGTYTIPTGIKKLEIGSFADTCLTKLIIPNGVTSVDCAFIKTPNVTGYSLYNIYFNGATPPSMTTSGRSSYETELKYTDIKIYVPSPSVKTYKNNSGYNGKFADVLVNDGDDAEILGIKIKGTVGAGPYSPPVSTFSDDEEDEEVDENDNKDLYTGYAHLDLASEELTVSITIKPSENVKQEKVFKVAGYSTNGGTSWVAGDLTNAKLITALNTASQIKLSNSFDTSKKKPNVDSDIITFPNVQARPKSNPLNYKLFYNETNWGLVKAYTDTAFAASMTSFKYVLGENGKIPTSPNWSTNIPENGMKIDDYPAKGVKKAVYFLRFDAFVVPASDSADAIYYPNSKTWKVTPATKSKTPKYKVDYKREIIKLKKGDSLDGSDGAAKVDVSITDELDDGVKSVDIVKLPTGKKPGSMTQTLALAPRGTLTNTSFSVDKGKIKDKSLKLYEFSTNGTTWGKIPKFSASKTLYVRLKSNAKVKRGELEGNSASDSGTFTVTWDVYDTEKNKSGIVSAVITVTPETANSEVEDDDDTDAVIEAANVVIDDGSVADDNDDNDDD